MNKNTVDNNFNMQLDTELNYTFNDFLDAFHKATCKFFVSELMDLDLNPREKFYYLKDLIYTKYPKFISIFYGVLDEFGYNINNDIIDNIKVLVSKRKIQSIKDIIDNLKQCPYIIDIESLNEKIFIVKTTLGDYKVASISRLNDNNVELSRNAKLVTSTMPGYFEGLSNVNSYIVDNGFVMDYNNNIAMDKDDYDTLFNVEELSSVNCIYNNEELCRKGK